MPDDDHSSNGAPSTDGPISRDGAIATASPKGSAVASAANPTAIKSSVPVKPASVPNLSASVAMSKPAAPPAPPPAPFKPAASMPLSMTNSPTASALTDNDREIAGASDDEFALAIAQLKPISRPKASLAERLFGGLRERLRDENRHVAFDGYRGEQHDDKIERDRRYGTVYSVTEYENAYLVRLELPRQMPSSSLKQLWRLGAAKPEYDCEIKLNHNVLSIHCRLRGEALRRLAYVSPSFPSGFLTRIEFAEPVARIVHRLNEAAIEVIGFKSSQMKTENARNRHNQGVTAVTE